jgi:hypothetical protein
MIHWKQIALAILAMIAIILIGTFILQQVTTSPAYNESINQWLAAHPNATIPTTLRN